MTDSNGKGPLYFVFLNDKKELIYAGTTDGINDNDNIINNFFYSYYHCTRNDFMGGSLCFCPEQFVEPLCSLNDDD